MTLSFRVYGVASGMGSKRAFIPKGWTRPIVTDSNRSLKSWQALVAAAANKAIHAFPPGKDRALILGPVRLSLAFYFPRPKSLAKKLKANTGSVDLDKAVRAVGDALSGVVYHDDRQVVELVAGKFYAAFEEAPHVDVRVEPTEGCEPVRAPAAPMPLFALDISAGVR